MQAKIRVRRYDPESSEQPHLQEYDVDVPEHFSVLDALVKVREEIDPSLALRCSCRAAICGSCAMRVNDRARLACNTRLTSVVDEGGEVRVEPMGNQRVVKDLVIDLQLFWGKVRAVEPYLQPDREPEEEFIASNESMLNLLTPMGCIMCGACVSDCTALEVDQNFLGPAALAKSYRFVADPRDDQGKQRLSTPQRVPKKRRRVGLYALLHVRGGLPQGRRADGSHHGVAGVGDAVRRPEHTGSAARRVVRALGRADGLAGRDDARRGLVGEVQRAENC